MKRRWFIRILFMLPVLLCVVGWGWSGTHDTSVAYRYGGRDVCLGTWKGILSISWGVSYDSPGWEAYNEPLNPPEFWPSKPVWADERSAPTQELSRTRIGRTT